MSQKKPTGPGLVPSALVSVGAAGGGFLFVLLGVSSQPWMVVAALVISGIGSTAGVWMFVQRAGAHYGDGRSFPELARIVAIGFALMFGLFAAAFFYGWKQDRDCQRFRGLVAGGGIPGTTTLSQLTNAELRTRTSDLVSLMRNRDHHYQDAVDTVSADEKSGKLTYEQADKQINDIRRQCGRELESTIRSNMELTLSELRTRIPAERRKDIPTLPQINSVDPGGQKLDLGMVLPSGFCLGLMSLRAQELEKLAMLLPDD